MDDLQANSDDFFLEAVITCIRDFNNDFGYTPTAVLVDYCWHKPLCRAVFSRCHAGSTYDPRYLTVNGVDIVPAAVAPGVKLPMAYADK